MSTPIISLSYVSGSGCSGSEGATVNVAITVSSQTDSGILAGTYDYTYDLYDSNGNLLDTQVNSSIAFGDYPPDYVFTPTEFPFYRVTGTLDNGVETPEVEELGISILNAFTIYIDSCANYSIKNCSPITEGTLNATVKVTDFNGVQVGEILTLDAQTSVSFIVPSDGIYYANILDDTDTVIYTFLVIEYCNILSCVSSRIKSILCSCQASGSSRCKDYCASRYDMNRILPLTYFLFNYLNKEYSLNIIYTAVDNAKVVELSSVKDVIDTLSDLCSECNDDLSGFEGTAVKKSNSSDCGCGCS